MVKKDNNKSEKHWPLNIRQWDTLTAGEKIQCMREQIISLERYIDRLRRESYAMQRHEHSAGGAAMIPLWAAEEYRKMDSIVAWEEQKGGE